MLCGQYSLPDGSYKVTLFHTTEPVAYSLVPQGCYLSGQEYPEVGTIGTAAPGSPTQAPIGNVKASLMGCLPDIY
jgi:hypothetical protein